MRPADSEFSRSERKPVLTLLHTLLKGLGAGNADGEGCSVSTFEEFAHLDTCYQGAEDETWPACSQAVYWAGLPSLEVCAVCFALRIYKDTFSKEVQTLTPLRKT